ncbi:MAG: hypothetical protein ACXWIU_08945 [Limisphaerales bacterium]
MRTQFTPKTLIIPAGLISDLDLSGEFFTVVSVVGTVTAIFTENGSPCPLFAGISFRCSLGERFKRIWFQSAAGATLVVIYGFGSVSMSGSAGGGGAAASNDVIGAVDDPNAGALTPTDPASFSLYYKDQAFPAVVWAWSVTNQNWFNVTS